MKTLSLRRAKSAFTLIELLVVICIIGILMALLFPAIGSAVLSAQKAQAKNDVVNLANAATAYELEYGKLPPTSGGGGADADATGTVDGKFLGALTGISETDNPRKVVFIEISEWKKGKGGVDDIDNPTTYVDPWGSNRGDVTHAYQLTLDTNYDNKVKAKTFPTGGAGAGMTDQDIRKKIAIWSVSLPPGANSSVNKRYFVNSYE
jgi:prepilin-type N-terminal cleavage/methylation domain-containing protein